MATSDIQIANMALSHVGASVNIESFEENSIEANLCSLWYATARREALKAHDWTFARKRITLAEHGDAPPSYWAYRYQYPADCLVIRRIPNPARPRDGVPFEVEISTDETKSILTSLGEAEAVYTFDQTSTAMFTPFFDRLLSYLLASYIGMPLTGLRSIRSDMYTVYKRELTTAPGPDANEHRNEDPLPASWHQARD